MDLLYAIELSVYLLGTFLFGALVLYAWLPRPRGLTGFCSPTLGIEFGIMLTSLAWFVANLANAILRWVPDFDRLPIQLVQLSLQLLYPPLIMHVVYTDIQRSERPLRPGRWVPWYRGMYFASLALFAWLLALVFGILPGGDKWSYPVVGIGSGVLFAVCSIYSVLAMTIAARKRKKESVEERSSRRSMALLFGVMLVFVAIIFIAEREGAELGRYFSVFGASMPMLFIFTSLYHENRFGFVDLAVKRGLSFMLTYGVLVVFFAYAYPRLTAFHGGGIGPWVLAISMLPLAMALPAVFRKLDSVLDNYWLGRRYTTVDAVKEFLAGMQSATDERDLIEQAERGLLRIFRATTRIELGLSQALPLNFDCVVDIPITAGTERIGVILMGRRENHTPYMSEDRALLESLAEVFSYMLENIRLQRKKQQQEQRAKELSHQASLSELKALRAQINPHFLFNALNAIAGLIHKDPLRADNTVEQLAEVFRYTLRRSEKEWARLEDELEFVGAYLEVEQARFGERLKISIESDAALGGVRMPTMVVQTLVENAVKHGVASVRGEGSIEITARRDGSRMRIEVADNGAGPDTGTSRSGRKGEGFGLRSIRERLHGYFGDDAELTLERDDSRGLTIACLSIPLDHEASSTIDEDLRGKGSVGAESA